jgi:hypothetical protein
MKWWGGAVLPQHAMVLATVLALSDPLIFIGDFRKSNG